MPPSPAADHPQLSPSLQTALELSRLSLPPLFQVASDQCLADVETQRLSPPALIWVNSKEPPVLEYPVHWLRPWSPQHCGSASHAAYSCLPPALAYIPPETFQSLFPGASAPDTHRTRPISPLTPLSGGTNPPHLLHHRVLWILLPTYLLSPEPSLHIRR